MSFKFDKLSPAIGFAATPTVGGFSYTLTSLLGKFLLEAERRFGTRDMSYTILGVEFCGDVPMVWYPENCGHVSIMLTDSAREDSAKAVWQLAHEVVHLLSPSGTRNANVAEEGLATWFSIAVADGLNIPYIIEISSYAAAKDLFVQWLDIDAGGVKKTRSIEPAMWKWTPEHLVTAVPDTPLELAKALCVRFVR